MSTRPGIHAIDCCCLRCVPRSPADRGALHQALAQRSRWSIVILAIVGTGLALGLAVATLALAANIDRQRCAATPAFHF